MPHDFDDDEEEGFLVSRPWGYEDARAMGWAQLRLEAMYGPRVELADGTVYLHRWAPRRV